MFKPCPASGMSLLSIMLEEFGQKACVASTRDENALPDTVAGTLQLPPQYGISRSIGIKSDMSLHE
jgi:hypothetical protein